MGVPAVLTDRIAHMRCVNRIGPIVALGALAVIITGCTQLAPSTGVDITDSSGFTETASDYSQPERAMLNMSHQIDSTFALTTTDTTWLAIQADNCRVARDLAGGDPSSVDWYMPPGKISSAYLDEQHLLGSSVAASLVSGCGEHINTSWVWPEFWGFIRANSTNSGARVQCADGSWSDAGGKQGACSWHDGVPD